MISAQLVGQNDIEASLLRLGALAGDLRPERDVASEFLADRIDDNFQNSESLFAPLADSTKKSRRSKGAKGAKLVADENTPLRAFGDSIREAATALTEGVIGSAFQEGDGSDGSRFTNLGVDEDGSSYMKRALLGDLHKPERNAIALDESDLDEAQRRMEGSLLARLNGVI